MKLNEQEKRVLNSLFSGITGTTRNEMLFALYAAKPANDGTVDSQEIITLVNGLILKIYNAEPEEMQEVFAGIPYEV